MLIIPSPYHLATPDAALTFSSPSITLQPLAHATPVPPSQKTCPSTTHVVVSPDSPSPHSHDVPSQLDASPHLTRDIPRERTGALALRCSLKIRRRQRPGVENARCFELAARAPVVPSWNRDVLSPVGGVALSTCAVAVALLEALL